MESDPDFELFYSSNEDDDEEEEVESREGWKSSSIFDDPAVLSSWSSEAGLREGILEGGGESNSPASDEGMESPGNDDNQKHADSLIESIEILLNMDEEKSSTSKGSYQQKNETLSLDLPGSLSKRATEGEDKTVRISTGDTNSSKDTECFETESKVKSVEEPMVGPKKELEHGHGGKPKEDNRCLEKQLEPAQTVSNQTVVFTPQWKSETNGCFSCEMFPQPNSLMEVRRKEGPRHRRKVEEGCKHCVATINGQAEFLKLYQARNGPFKTQCKSKTPASGSEQGLKEANTNRGGQNETLSCETAVASPSEGKVLNAEAEKPVELAQVIARLKRELFDARVKQIAYMALNLALENMTPIVCSN